MSRRGRQMMQGLLFAVALFVLLRLYNAWMSG